jgi:hypothetical protein
LSTIVDATPSGDPDDREPMLLEGIIWLVRRSALLLSPGLPAHDRRAMEAAE